MKNFLSILNKDLMLDKFIIFTEMIKRKQKNYSKIRQIKNFEGEIYGTI